MKKLSIIILVLLFATINSFAIKNPSKTYQINSVNGSDRPAVGYYDINTHETVVTAIINDKTKADFSKVCEAINNFPANLNSFEIIDENPEDLNYKSYLSMIGIHNENGNNGSFNFALGLTKVKVEDKIYYELLKDEQGEHSCTSMDGCQACRYEIGQYGIIMGCTCYRSDPKFDKPWCQHHLTEPTGLDWGAVATLVVGFIEGLVYFF